MKPRRMRPAGHAAHMEVTRNVCSIFVGKPYRKGLLWRPTIDGRIILKLNLKIQCAVLRIEFAMVVTESNSRLVPDESERIWKEAVVT
jgi:hypothetical protein